MRDRVTRRFVGARGRLFVCTLLVGMLNLLGFGMRPVGAAAHVADSLAIVTTALPDGTATMPYAGSFAASGGTAPYTWSILTGAVPLGLVLSSTGSISGVPGAVGVQSIAIRVTDATGYSVTARIAITIVPPPPPPQEVTTASSHGVITSLGTAYPTPLVETVASSDVVGVASAPSGAGSWCVTRNGRVIPVGAVPSFGLVPRARARGAVVGIASNATGTGYWIVTKAGHVYGFGAAHSVGSLKARHSHAAVVGIARTNGSGYYLLQANGRVTGFGSQTAKGSLRARHLHLRISGIASTPTGAGYWVSATDGRVFSFGNARGDHVTGPTPAGTIEGIVAAPTGVGYYLVARDGAVFSYGSALPITPVTHGPGDATIALSSGA